MTENSNAYKVLVGIPKKGKRPVRKPRRRLENNIKMDLSEIGLDGTDWIHLSQDRNKWRALVNTVMNFWILLSVRKFLGR
jgi:hypothetical protein